MVRAARSEDVASALTLIGDVLNTKGKVDVIPKRTLVPGKRLQPLKNAGCFLPRDFCKLN